MLRLLAGLLGWLLLLPVAQAQVQALVVGHGSVEAEAAARNVASALGSRWGLPSAHVRLLVGPEATATALRNAMASAAQKSDTSLLVYVAGSVYLERRESNTEAGWLLLEGSSRGQTDRTPTRALPTVSMATLAANARYRSVLLLFDTPTAGLIPPDRPRPDTLLAAVAGSANTFPGATLVQRAASLREIVAALPASGMRVLPLTPIDLPRPPDAAEATLALPRMHPAAHVYVDGTLLPPGETTLRLAPGDHVVHATISGLSLWRSGVVLRAGERRVVPALPELLQAATLQRTASTATGELRVNDVVVPEGAPLVVPTGPVSVVYTPSSGRPLAAGRALRPGETVEVVETRGFAPHRVAFGSVVPGGAPFLSGHRREAAAMFALVGGTAAAFFFAEQRHQGRLNALASAQSTYDTSIGETATADARAQLLAAHDAANASHRTRRLALGVLGVGLSINVLDALLHHSRRPVLQLRLRPAP